MTTDADKIVAELMALALRVKDTGGAYDYGEGDEAPYREARDALEQAIRRAVDSSLEAAKPEPGWELVPAEPTEEMLAAADDAPERAMARSRDDDNAAIYRAMLAAAPSPGSGI